MNAKAENVFKICHLLGISPDTLAEWGVTDEPQQPNAHDIDEIIANAMMFDGKPLTDDDKRAIRGIIAGYMSSKEKWGAMTENELLEQFNVSICEFSSNEWSRNGFIDPVNRVVYINGDLSPNTRLKVILHELGHLEHNFKDYERLREKYEAQANRSMIHELLKNENLDDFNYLHFMEKYNLTTICDETFVKNEYLKMMR